MDQSGSILFNLFIIAILLFINGFFVAAEFALVKVRKTRLEQLSNEGNKSAKLVCNVIENHLNDYLALAQLGITVASIALGWVGEATIVKVIEPLITLLPFINPSITSHAIAVPISFVSVTFFHVLLGEQLPKCMAIQYAEGFSLHIIGPIYIINKIFRPFVWLLAEVNNKLLKLFNVEPDSTQLVHSTEELDMLVNASFNEGVLNETEAEMLHNMFKFSDLSAKQVMIPRTDMICIPSDISYEDLNKIALENQYTRYPVYEENIDHILGFIHVKDLYSLSMNDTEYSLDKIIRPIKLVPETMTLDNLIIDFKKQHCQLAIVIDEFGGTSGLITLEDILEEIIGEVQDEFDEEEANIKEIAPNTYSANAMVRIDEIAEFFDINPESIEDEDVDTIGGLVIKTLGRIAQIDDSIEINDLTFIVKEIDGARITKLTIIKNVKIEENSETL